ncbi:MAG: ankyrin repeat domain-containing protein [Verrucomicrobiota bacterium]|jgi:ankyrin repeat protein
MNIWQVSAGDGERDYSKVFLDYGVMTNHADVDATTSAGFTPLHTAAGHGYKDVVQLLLAHDANVNAKATNSVTPLDLAASNGRKDVAVACQGAHEFTADF